MGRDYCALSVAFAAGQFSLKHITCIDAEKGKAEVVKDICSLKGRSYGEGAKKNYETSLSVILKWEKGVLCQFSYSADGKKYTTIPDKFQAREGKWIGAKYGVFSIAPAGKTKGWVDIKQ